MAVASWRAQPASVRQPGSAPAPHRPRHSRPDAQLRCGAESLCGRIGGARMAVENPSANGTRRTASSGRDRTPSVPGQRGRHHPGGSDPAAPYRQAALQLLARTPGRHRCDGCQGGAVRAAGAQPFDNEQLDMMAAFADQAALAWQLASTQRQMRELDILTDRDRIARDLHDHVIQRLFAVGLSLQGTIPRARSPEVQQRLTECVDNLQQVIQEIRTAIFDLHGGSAGSTRLRQRIDEAVAQFSTPDLRTTVQFVGPLSVVGASLADHAEAVVREAVSNAVRHANATTLTVSVLVEDEFVIQVA